MARRGDVEDDARAGNAFLASVDGAGHGGKVGVKVMSRLGKPYQVPLPTLSSRERVETNLPIKGKALRDRMPLYHRATW